MTDKTIFQQYYEVKHQLDSLQVLESKLRDQVTEELQKLPASVFDKSTYRSDFGNFTKKVSERYSFSTNIAELGVDIQKQIKEYSEPFLKQIKSFSKPLEEKLETAKQNEIDTGKAVKQTSVTMAFAYKKEDGEIK